MRAAGQIIGTTILNEIRWATSPDRTSDEVVGLRPLSARLLSMLLRPTAPPLTVGIMVAASFIVAETLLVSLLMKIVPEMAFGVIFLLGVLVVSAGWGFGLAVLTTLASALVYAFFHLDADGIIFPITAEDWVAIIIFLPIALLANVLAGQARLRAAEANQRRREAEASRDELRVLAEQQAALRRVATLVARGVPPSQVFSAVADELGRVLGVSHSTLIRYEPDGTSIRMAVCEEPGLDGMQVGETFPNDGESVAVVSQTSWRILISNGGRWRIRHFDEKALRSSQYYFWAAVGLAIPLRGWLSHEICSVRLVYEVCLCPAVVGESADQRTSNSSRPRALIWEKRCMATVSGHRSRSGDRIAGPWS
jgi:hypothetical protein